MKNTRYCAAVYVMLVMLFCPLLQAEERSYESVGNLNRLKAQSTRWLGKTIQLKLQFNGVAKAKDGTSFCTFSDDDGNFLTVVYPSDLEPVVNGLEDGCWYALRGLIRQAADVDELEMELHNVL